MINIRFSSVLGALAILAAAAVPAMTAQVGGPPPIATSEWEFTAKLNMCGDCHGEKGVPRLPNVPIIWGQDENYLLQQMHEFRNKERDIELMWWASLTLYESELQAAMANFAKRPWPARTATAATTPAPAGMGVCQACHQADYRGARQAEGMPTPRLAGQSYEYLVESMRQFADGTRKNNPTMTQLMQSISPADRQAMARYLSGL